MRRGGAVPQPRLPDRLAELLPLLVVLLILGGLQVARLGLDHVPSLSVTPMPTPTVAAPATRLPQRPLRVESANTGNLEGCTAGGPRFQGGLAELKRSLGRIMGDPLDCERVVNPEGDTEQHTSTGLAYYLKTDNVPAFTDGQNRWALTSRGIVHWTGAQLSPPDSASPLPR
jgi:hypothetical protein